MGDPSESIVRLCAIPCNSPMQTSVDEHHQEWSHAMDETQHLLAKTRSILSRQCLAHFKHGKSFTKFCAPIARLCHSKEN